MDTYSKGILTVIALLLAVIATGIWLPYLDTGLNLHPPTLGDFQKLQDIGDQEAKSEVLKELLQRMPYVKVHGSVDVDM